MNLQRIDELTRRDHYYLGNDDECYFFGEYSARNGRSFGDTNELIVNLSVPVKYRNTAKWTRRERAVSRLGQLFGAAFAPDRIRAVTFVPLPPVQPKEHPAYDDKMRAVLQAMGAGLDVRELIVMVSAREVVELSSLRVGPDVLFSSMRVVSALADPAPSAIFLCGDVLVTGANFVAARRRLEISLPHVPVFGLFAARKLLETDEYDDPSKF